MKPIAYYGFGLLLLMVLTAELAGRDYTALDFALIAFVIAVVALRGFKNLYSFLNDISPYQTTLT